MNIFANKKIWKKILIIIGVISFIAVVFPRPVGAAESNAFEYIGGVLMNAIASLFMGLADGIMTLIHKIFANQDKVFYIISEGIVWWKVVIGVLIAVALAVIVGISIPQIIIGAALVVTLTIAGGGTRSVTYQTITPIASSMLAGDSITLPDITLTPYEIFSDEKDIFNVNFFKPTTKEDEENNTLVYVLGQNIKNWYLTLTQIAIVGMLSVLVYIGIRMTLSSVADSKAKYKQMLWDWMIAMCLIFVMRYIMVFSNLFVDQITKTIGTIKVESTSVSENNDKENPMMEINGVEGFLLGATGKKDEEPKIDKDMTSRIKKAYELLVDKDEGKGETQQAYKPYFWKNTKGAQANSASEAKVLFWPAHNFLVQARLRAQLIKDSIGAPNFDYVGYVIIYVALAVYTCIFIFVYIRRFVYMAFLTLISPLVALTYPIDKVKDGQAQAFNYWFREYLYNLLLQPLHLLLYMLLIGSAMKFATNNPLYVIICLGFMVPAEKLLKEMFGFKGKTPGSMPGVATAALMMHATRSIFGGKSSKGVGAGKGSTGKDGGTSEDKDDLIFNKTQPYNSRLYAGDESGSDDNSSQRSRDAELDEKAENNQLPSAEELATQDNEINLENANNGRNYTDDERWDILREGNPDMTDEEIAQTLGMDVPRTVPDIQLNNNQAAPQLNLPQNDVVDNEMKNEGWIRRHAGAAKRAAINGVKGKISDTVGSKKWWANGAKNTASELLRTSGRLATGAVGAGIGAAAGGLAGMVSGDPSKAFENMTVGGFAGYKVLSSVGDRGATTTINAASEFSQNYKSELYAGHKEEYDEEKMNEHIKKWMNNKNNTDIIKRSLGDDGYNRLKDEGAISEFIRSGNSDARDLVAVEKFSEQYNMSREDAISVLEMRKEVGEGLKGKDSEKWTRHMENKFMSSFNTKDRNDPRVTQSVQKAKEYMNNFNTIRKKI